MKRSKLLLLLIFPILLALFLLRNLLFKPSLAGWFDDNWHYRREIPVTNNVAQETNVYIIVTLDTSDTTKFQTDAGDLRFTKYNGELLPYYISSGVGTTSTEVHVNFDVFPSGSQTIYYYYGNPSAENGFSASSFSSEATDYTIGTIGSEEVGGGPVGYWKFDEGTGSTAYDSTSNRSNGTISGASWQTEDKCISGECLYYDGDDYVNFGDILDNTFNADFSVSYWFKEQSTPDNWINYILFKGSSGVPYFSAGTTGSIDSSNVGKITIRHNNDAVLGYSNKTYVDNNWHHIGITRNDSGNQVKLYIDGVLDKTFGDITYTDTGSFIIGGRDITARGFTGFIDEVKIYPYAQTVAQIKADYNARGTTKGTSVAMGGGSDKWLSDGLVGYWKMDESSGNSSDSSGNGNSINLGVSGSAPTYAAGKFGNNLSFDGTDDYSYVADKDLWDFAGKNVTVAFWFKANVTQSTIYPTLIHHYAGGASPTGWSWQFSSSTNKVSFGHAGTNGISLPSTNTYNDATWHHATVVLDNSSSVATLFIDGQKDGSDSFSGLIDLDKSLEIGGRVSDVYAFGGMIDEIRIYHRALSPSEVRDLYNWAPGPVAYYDFEDGSGDTVSDKSGNGIGGTWNGTGSHWTTGKFGKAGNFNGSDDWISTNTSPNLQIQQHTLSAWINSKIFDVAGDYNGIVEIDSGTDIKARLMTYGNTATIRYNPSYSDNIDAFADINSLSPNTWYYVTGTWDGTTARIYLNGVEVDSDPFSGPITYATAHVQIGKNKNMDRYWDGLIDEVRIYNYARTPKQIVEDMNAGHPAVGSPVGSAVAHYKFDEGYNTTVNNSGNGGSGYNLSLGTGSTVPNWTNDGKFGKALSFGINSLAQMTTYQSNTEYTGSGGLTLSAWIKVDPNESNGGFIISKPWNASGQYNYTLSYNSTIGFGLAGATSYSLGTTETVSKGIWHYVAATANNVTQEVRIYIDGRLSKSGTNTVTDWTPSSGNSNRALTIGCIYPYTTTCSAGTSYAFYGLIDEVKIYNYALSEDEVKLDYNQGSAMVLGTLSSGTGNTAPSSAASQEYCIPGDTSTCSAPVARWDFEEGSGTTVNDLSGNGNSGTWNGTGSPRYTTGKVGKAGKFNGDDDYVDTADISTVELNNVTFSFWGKINNTTKDHDFITKGTHGTNQPLIIWFDDAVGGGDKGITNTNTISVLTYDGSIQHWVAAPTNTINDTNWHYIVAVINPTNNQIKIYVDGKLVEQNTKSWNGIQNTATAIRLGNPTSIPNSCALNGFIDQVRIYDYARSPAQIAWDYNRGAPVGHWKFDECQGTTAHDSIGTNHGTINIGASAPQTALGTCATASTSWGNGATGKYNSSLNFDGADDYVSFADDRITIAEDRPWALSTWIKVDTFGAGTTYPGIFGNELATSKFQRLQFNNNSTELIIEDKNNSGTGTTYKWTHGMITGQWYHLVVVNSGADSNNLTLYVNSISKGTISMATTEWEIRQIGGRGGTGHKFDGQIDDVRVYNYALTATQVKTLYNDGAVRFGE